MKASTDHEIDSQPERSKEWAPMKLASDTSRPWVGSGARHRTDHRSKQHAGNEPVAPGFRGVHRPAGSPNAGGLPEAARGDEDVKREEG